MEEGEEGENGYEKEGAEGKEEGKGEMGVWASEEGSDYVHMFVCDAD